MKKLFFLVFILTLTTGVYSQKSIKVAALKGPTGLAMVELINSKTQLEGTKTDYKIVGTPQLVVAGLLSGEYDIAALPTNLASIVYNRKPDYSLIAVTGEGTLYLLTSRDDINSWKDLDGKKVYNIARQSTPGFMFNKLLKENNLDSVEIDYSFNHTELAPMLIAGKVDTGILPEPLATKVLLKNKDMKVALDFQDEYKRTTKSDNSYPLSCIVASNELIKNNPEAIKHFLKELNSSIRNVNNNPLRAGQVGEAVGLGVTGPLIKKSIDRLNLGFVSSKNAKSNLESYYNILFESDPKSIGGKLPGEEFYYGE